LIHEYALLTSFFVLSFLLLFTNISVLITRNINFISESDLTEEGTIQKSSSRLVFGIKAILFFATILCFCKILICLIGPVELLNNKFVVQDSLLFLIFNYVFLIVWSILLYALHIQKKIVPDERFNYLTKLFIFYNIFILSDLFLNLIIYLNGLNNSLLPKKASEHIMNSNLNTDNQLMFIILAVIILLYLVLYITFILKRSLRLMQQYWFMLFILLLILFIYFYNRTSEQLGIISNVELGLNLLTWNYYYLGWIILVFFALTIYSNISAMIIYTTRQNLIDVQRSKNSMLSFIKLGFLTTICLTVLILLPEAVIYFS
jgi:hypothetical protein